MKKFLLLIIGLLILFACNPPDDNINNPPDDDTVTVEIFDIVGQFDMNDGPHALAVKGDYVFACRDDKIFVVDISNVATPELVTTIDDLTKSNIFETLLIVDNTLYAGCTSSSGVYIIDITNPASPSITGKSIDEIYEGKKISPLKLFYDNNILWAAGSNGLNAMLVKYNVQTDGTLTFDKYWSSTQTSNIAGGVWANSSNVFISTADGYVYSFNSSDISTGPIGSFTFEAESGHSHWGKTIIGLNNQLFWADWGAGFITIDISDPANLTAANLITNSAYKAQFPDAEGTNVYDFVLDNSTGKLYVANGWSGLLKIDINSTDKVEDYVDYFEQQYFCITKSNENVLVGNISGGTSGTKGIKIIKVE